LQRLGRISLPHLTLPSLPLAHLDHRLPSRSFTGHSCTPDTLRLYAWVGTRTPAHLVKEGGRFSRLLHTGHCRPPPPHVTCVDWNYSYGERLTFSAGVFRPDLLMTFGFIHHRCIVTVPSDLLAAETFLPSDARLRRTTAFPISRYRWFCFYPVANPTPTTLPLHHDLLVDVTPATYRVSPPALRTAAHYGFFPAFAAFACTRTALLRIFPPLRCLAFTLAAFTLPRPLRACTYAVALDICLRLPAPRHTTHARCSTTHHSVTDADYGTGRLPAPGCLRRAAPHTTHAPRTQHTAPTPHTVLACDRGMRRHTYAYLPAPLPHTLSRALPHHYRALYATLTALAAG